MIRKLQAHTCIFYFKVNTMNYVPASKKSDGFTDKYNIHLLLTLCNNNSCTFYQN